MVAVPGDVAHLLLDLHVQNLQLFLLGEVAYLDGGGEVVLLYELLHYYGHPVSFLRDEDLPILGVVRPRSPLPLYSGLDVVQEDPGHCDFGGLVVDFIAHGDDLLACAEPFYLL